MYYHGITTDELSTAVPSPDYGTSGLQVVVGTAPVNLLDDPSSAVNVPLLIKTFAEAKEQLGYSEDFESFTLCQSMYTNFKVFHVSPVVFINVLDPATHYKAMTSQSLTVSNKIATLEVTGVLLDSLTVVADETTLEADTDYIAAFDDNGYVTITMISTGAAASATSITVSGNVIDPSAVTASDIIGTVNAETLAETGLQLIRRVYPKFGIAPGLLLAPGWSKNAAVGVAMAAKCEEINGCFQCECLLDISTDDAKVYTAVGNVKESNAWDSEHAIALWPCINYNGMIVSYSAAYAALCRYYDQLNDDCPATSSNRLLQATDVCLEDGTSVSMDFLEANEINAEGVVTAINSNGIVTWGNNTCAYPENTDPKDRWISVRRMFTWVENSFITTYIERVDSNASYVFIENLVDEENIRLSSLASENRIAGGKVTFNRDDNDIADILDGKLTLHTALAPWTPAEYITNTYEFDVSTLSAALSGGEE